MGDARTNSFLVVTLIKFQPCRHQVRADLKCHRIAWNMSIYVLPRTDGRTDEWTDGQTDGRIVARTDGRTDGRTVGRTNGRTDKRRSDARAGESCGGWPDDIMTIRIIRTHDPTNREHRRRLNGRTIRTDWSDAITGGLSNVRVTATLQYLHHA